MRQRERQTGQKWKRKRFFEVHGLRAPRQTSNDEIHRQVGKRQRKERKRKRLDKIDRNMGMNQEEIRAKNKQKRLKIAHHSPPLRD